MTQPCFRGIDSAKLAELTRKPARNGFQATLMAPFRVRPPLTEADLRTALADFVACQQPIVLPPLAIEQENDCFCLRPLRHCTAVHALAARCTRAFDRFRDPLLPSELARSKAAQLSGQEKRNLELWGSPYVFEQFRFHLTLTGRMSEGKNRERVHAALIEFFGPCLQTPVQIDGLCLFVEPAFGLPLHSLGRFPFALSAPDHVERIGHDQQLFRQDLHPRYQCRPA